MEQPNSTPPKKPLETLVKEFQDEAIKYNHEALTLEHALSVLAKLETVQKLMSGMGVKVEDFNAELEKFLSDPKSGIPALVGARPQKTTHIVAYLKLLTITQQVKGSEPTEIEMFIKLLETAEELRKKGEETYLVFFMDKYNLSSLGAKRFDSHGAVNRELHGMDGFPSKASITTPEEANEYLKLYCKDLNSAAKDSKIDPLIGRLNEVDHLTQTIARRTKNNVVLVGEAGVGKTAIVEGLAKKIVEGEVPEILKDSVIWSLEIGDLMAGTRFRGDLEERMKNIINSLILIPNAILFIDEIHTMMGSGGGRDSALDVANMLKPALSRREFTVIGSTTYDEYINHFEKDKALSRRFKKIEVEEPSIEDAKLILFGLKGYYEEFHGIVYTVDAINAAVDLSAKYINNTRLPDKAIDLMDAAGARQRITPPETRLASIGVEEIETEISKITKISKTNITPDELEQLNLIETGLRANVFGQDKAIERIVDDLGIHKAGLRRINKPIGSYLFTGPTGVGKTEIAKTIAKEMGIPLFKYDMSEFMEEHSVSKLIGAPPGYVGFDEVGNGQLINDVEKNGHCVVLLDEIEKAHPRIYDLLLQVTDDGKLKNSSNKTTYFRNVILIMTSNAGAQELQRNSLGFGKRPDGEETADLAVIKKMFRPEFLNRLDAIVSFNSLTPTVMGSIVNKFVAELDTMASAKSLTLNLTEAAKEWLAVNGYDPKMGARPLERLITDNIKKPLSKLILGALRLGGTAKIDAVDGKLAVTEDTSISAA